MKTEIRNSISGLFFIPLLFTCFALLPGVQAAPDPAPPPGANTRDGAGAMAHITTGQFNTAFGTNALNTLTTGNNNSAQGNSALFTNNGNQNVGVGNLTLRLNTTGSQNVAVGANALNSNLVGNRNTAVGQAALTSNTASDNVAVGFSALFHSTGLQNTGVGSQALQSNTGGEGNSAVGFQALFNNTLGVFNNGFGFQTLNNNLTGDLNTAIGDQAGFDITGSGNVIIGAGVPGAAATSNTTWIKNVNTTAQATSASVDFVTVRLSDSRLGHVASSLRYKEDIKPMDKASEVLYQLKPVTYRFKNDIESTQNLDYGLIAEDVAKVDPKLAIRDGNGQIESVRYMAIYNMLLNEFLKEHKKVEELEATVASLATAVKEQAAQIQKVSAQLEVNRPAPRTVANK